METNNKNHYIIMLRTLVTDSQHHMFNGNFEEAMNVNYRIIHWLTFLMEKFESTQEELNAYKKCLSTVCKWAASSIKLRRYF